MHIQTQQQLEEICQRAQSAGCIGFDSEFIPENTYYPKLALIQFAVGEACYIVDPLSSLDLSPLEALICSEDVVVVVHAGAQDMGIFFHRTGIVPRQVFDTQIAATFLGMGHQVSYGSLVQQLFNVSLQKGHSFTNWLKRPLKPEQIQYALEDVAYLVPAYEKIIASLERIDRLSWVADELRHYEDEQFYIGHESHPEKRVKKSGQLQGRDLLTLEALAKWREDEAQTRDLPRKKVLSDYTLVDLARRRPRTTGELMSLRSADHLAKRYAKDLVRVIAVTADLQPPEKTHRSGASLDENQKLLVEYLSFCLKAFCLQEKLASVMLSTRSELERLVSEFFSDHFNENDHRLLTGWRKDAVGKNILLCMRGELCVKFDSAQQTLRFLDPSQLH